MLSLLSSIYRRLKARMRLLSGTQSEAHAQPSDFSKNWKLQLRRSRKPRLVCWNLRTALGVSLSAFPYIVIYRVLAKSIEILALAHGRRRPGYWRSRVPNQVKLVLHKR